MKSLFLALVVSVLTAASPAFAQDAEVMINDQIGQEQITESQDLKAFDADAAIHIDFGRRGIGFSWSPGRRPHWGHPGRPPMVACQARNARGIAFFGRGWTDDEAARRAIHECRNSRHTYNPRTCRVVDCRWTR